MGQQGHPPGFRFSPTDEELVVHYLKNRACGKDFHQGVITEVDIYKHEPWELPEKSVLPSLDPVWYFFNTQDKKHSHTARINRTTTKGYWKATGKDRKIFSGSYIVGIKKTLIYYEGRAPSGKRTDWIMHEYKLDEEFEKKSKTVCSTALCRVRKKGGPGPRNGEQYGASVLHENNECVEDVEEDVDEKLPILSDSRSEISATSIPHQINEPKDKGRMGLSNLQTEGCGSNDLSQSEGLDTNADLDLYAFLESFLTNDTEATSFESEIVPPNPVSDKTFGHQHSDLSSLLKLDDEFVDDILCPTSGEEQILEELLLYGEEGPLAASNVDCNGHILLQPPVFSDRTVAINDDIMYGDDVAIGVPGDFIELDDMISPLDGFMMRSPLQEPPFLLLSEPSPDLLHAQGSASRRARLQIVPPCVNTLRANVQEQNNTVPNQHPKVYPRAGSSENNIQKAGGISSQNIGSLFSGAGEENSEVVLETFLSKHTSLNTVTKCEEVPQQVFFMATTGSQDEESSIHDSKRATLQVGPEMSLSQFNTSSGMQEASSDCEAGRTDSISENVNTNSCIEDASFDYKSGSTSAVVMGVKSRHSVNALSRGNRVISELVSKVKSLSLGRGFVQLDSSLSTTFNGKVFALGKPVAQLVPSKDYVNPYRSLRRGAMASLFQLVITVIFLFFVFLVIHMLTKYVLSVAVRA